MAISTTYAPSGITNSIREDLEDVITNIAPTDTVFMSNIGKKKVQSTYHEWLTDTLATAANCAVTEGNDAVLATPTAAERTGNYTQISAKSRRSCLCKFARWKTLRLRMKRFWHVSAWAVARLSNVLSTG